MGGGLEVIAGRSYGPFRTAVSAAKIAEFVAATGDEERRWTGHAPPGYAATLLFTAAPSFFADTDVAPYTSTVIHSNQHFIWNDPLPVGTALSVGGRIETVRARRGLNLVTFVVTATADGGEPAVVSNSTFLMSTAAEPPASSPEEPEPPAVQRARNDVPADLDGSDAIPDLAKSASRADLVRYAGASRDFNPIHWDHAAAVAAGLPGVIVHGLLMGSWAAQAAARLAPGSPSPLLDLKLRFRKPLRPAVAAAVACESDGGDDGPLSVRVAVRAGGEDLVTGTAGVRVTR